MINSMVSRRIYSELNSGHVVNRKLYDEGREKDNPLYLELFNEKHNYTDMYEAIGFELVHEDGFFFIRDIDMSNPYREATAKLVALLTILGRAVMQQGYRFELLTGEGGGCSMEMAQEVDGKEEYMDILAAVGLKGPFWQDLNKQLIERRIAYINDAGRLVLADSGKTFFNTVFEEGDTELS